MESYDRQKEIGRMMHPQVRINDTNHHCNIFTPIQPPHNNNSRINKRCSNNPTFTSTLFSNQSLTQYRSKPLHYRPADHQTLYLFGTYQQNDLNNGILQGKFRDKQRRQNIIERKDHESKINQFKGNSDKMFKVSNKRQRSSISSNTKWLSKQVQINKTKVNQHAVFSKDYASKKLLQQLSSKIF